MARFGFFGNAIDAWLDHPVAGVGPGGYPFSYFLTDYFAKVNYAPRHPDNAVAQLIVETGLLGVASATIVLVAMVSAARSRWRANPAATWALTAFLVACVGTNPTDFLFLLVPALIWAAILVSASPKPSSSPLPPRQERPLTSRLVTLAALPVMAAVLLTAAGSIAYQVANDRYRAGDAVGAAHALDAAVALDPGQALYWRERGSLHLASGNPEGGITAFKRSLALVPWDPGARRGLALAHLASGDSGAGLADALAAARIQPHSAASAIVVAVASLQRGELDTSARALSTALLEAPYLGFEPWPDTVLGQFDVGQALAAAAQTAGGYRAGETGVDAVLVVLMAGGGDALAAASSGSTISGRALAAVADCDQAAAEREIRLATAVEREYVYFWIASSVVSQVFPGVGASGPELAARSVGLPGSPGPVTSSLVADGGEDVLRYRRTSLDVRTPTTAMPSVSRGLWLLTNDPTKAMSLVTRWPPSCPSGATR
jgi:tetratricopeptide (TPR) repeat protein